MDRNREGKKRHTLLKVVVVIIILSVIVSRFGNSTKEEAGTKADTPGKAVAQITESASAKEESEEASITDESFVESESAERVESEEKEDVPFGVDPDLKAFLDSYEAYMDEYIEFMEKYTSDPANMVSMMAEYGKMMERYTDFAEKIEKYDSDTMSDADARYYLEVTTRITQKMMSALY